MHSHGRPMLRFEVKMVNKEHLKKIAQQLQDSIKERDLSPTVEDYQFDIEIEGGCVKIALIGAAESHVRGFTFQNGSGGLTPPNYAGVRSSEEVRFMRELLDIYQTLPSIETRLLGELDGWGLTADVYVLLHNFKWRLHVEQNLIRLAAPEEKGWVNWNFSHRFPEVQNPSEYERFIDWQNSVTSIEDPQYTASLPPIHKDMGAAWRYVKVPLEQKGWKIERLYKAHTPIWQISLPGALPQKYFQYIWDKDGDAIALTRVDRKALLDQQKTQEEKAEQNDRP